MRCHYEVMGVERSAGADEIKKQYKKLALKWHPDRNFGQEEEAARAFKEISTAYSVLSDPHERQWYDDHRESILRGGDGTSSEDDEDGGLFNIWRFFNGSCFSGFDDSPTGFYSVYSEVFRCLTEQERSRSGKDTVRYPEFGSSDSSNEDVLFFYSQWENYVSEMPFSWADQYNVLEAPNRQVKRAMEKENSKARDSARKEWISNVRNLASFVKKRDPRFTAIEAEKANKKREEDARKAAAKTEEQRRRKELREQYRNQFVEDSEEREKRENERKGAFLLADNDDSDDDARRMVNSLADEDVDCEHLGSLSIHPISADGAVANGAEGLLEEDREEERQGGEETQSGSYHCLVCSKYFKSEAQLQQHNASKVHRKKVTESQRRNKAK